MQDPYCPECGVVQDLHSGIYCGIIREQRATYERKLELHREMGRIWSRDIDELEMLEEMSDKIIAKLVAGADNLLRDLDCIDARTLSLAKADAERWLQRNGGAITEQSSAVGEPAHGE
jgi:hypothetical protein